MHILFARPSYFQYLVTEEIAGRVHKCVMLFQPKIHLNVWMLLLLYRLGRRTVKFFFFFDRYALPNRFLVKDYQGCSKLFVYTRSSSLTRYVVKSFSSVFQLELNNNNKKYDLVFLRLTAAFIPKSRWFS